MAELTVRAILLGGLITLAFTAANVYLGLKVGLTFATSIPAAVISMAVLRLFKSSSIFENNIVQTVASAAGTLAAIIFVLPGLVIGVLVPGNATHDVAALPDGLFEEVGGSRIANEAFLREGDDLDIAMSAIAFANEQEAARNPLFGGRVAHGYFLISAAAGLFVE